MNKKNQKNESSTAKLTFDEKLEKARIFRKYINADKLNVSLPVETKQKIKQVAQEKGVTISDIVRFLIEDYLDTVKDKKN